MTGRPPTQTDSLPASVEILPKQIPTTAELIELLPRGVRVYLTDIGSAESEAEMLVAARRVQEADCTPVPHLAARRILSRDMLENRVRRLTGEAGVTDVLVIGGGVNPPVGPFASSITLLETGLLDRFGITDLAVAGYPEGSPDFSEAVAIRALRQKMEFAERTGARLRIVTQFGFDAGKALSWADNLYRGGIGIPIHIGVAGPAKIMTLLKYGKLCGVGNSLSLLTKRAGSLMSFATGYSPDTFVAPIEHHLSTTSQSPISQIHVFPFGGLDSSATWLKKRGSWKAGHRSALEVLNGAGI